MDNLPGAAADPILAQRARVARWANLGQRVGYGLLGVAVIAFLVAFVANFPSLAVAVSVAGLIGACVVLPPAIIAGFGVKAAEREERRARR